MKFPERPKPYSTRKNPTKSECAWLRWSQRMVKEIEKRIKILQQLNEDQPNDGFQRMRLQNIMIYQDFLECLK